MRKRRPTELVVTIAAFSAGVSLWCGRDAAAQMVDLPEWTSDDAAKFDAPGSALLGGGLWPIELQPSPVPPMPEAAEAMVKEAEGGEPMTPPDEITKFDVPKIVITRRGAGFGEEAATPEEMDEAALGPAGEIPEELRAAYFGVRPRAFLNDPQQLLSEQKTHDLSRFLEYHEGESKVAIYALIFGGRQDLPGGLSLRDIHEEWFGDEDAVLVAYFLGEPNRSILEFGDEAMARLGAETIAEALDYCMKEARVAQNSFNQLERFCIELSIRLYWIERNNAIVNGIGGEGETATEAPRKENTAGAGLSNRIDVRSIALHGLAFLAVLAALGWICWRHLRSVNRRTFIFPDYEVTPRLSAPHSGGAHAVMFFGKRDG